MNGQMHLALWGFVAVILLLGLAGIALFFGGIKRVFHGRFAGGGARLLLGLLLCFVFAFFAAVAMDLRTYLRLSYEQPVATLSFSALGPQAFRVTLTDANGAIRNAELRGDDWQLDARVLKWKGLATVLGLDPLYRLERLEGRYRNAAQESHDYHSVLELSAGGRGLDLWSLAQDHAGWLPWVDASYGSATYLPMADGAQYSVSLSPTGLLARAANPAAQAALAHW
ncbi:MAG TPA: cation/multidrug efflux pump [Gammaproteobacteria bacterium]|nr:cation/multidrug efflux pump [Gammaproteobacteria bacterium]